MNSQLFAPILLVAVVIWGAYRRIRRSIGPQRIEGRRLLIRVAIFTLLGTGVAVSVARQASMLAALLAGVAGGALLGHLGLRYTRFEVNREGRFYTPHTYFGLAVTALFVARLLYRALLLDHDMRTAVPLGQYALSVQQQNPLTLAMFGAVVGYYMVFYAGVLRRTRVPALPAQEDRIEPP